jgi:hypothetical protein
MLAIAPIADFLIGEGISPRHARVKEIRPEMAVT